MKIRSSDLQLQSLVERITSGEIKLQSDFQRGEVWDLKRKQRLIDTILREWYVPAIHVVPSSAGEEEVLDGQQRLASIRDFFTNKVRVDGNIEPLDNEIQKLDGLVYSQLPESTRRSLNRFALTVVVLEDYRPQEPNELFFRLNQAYTLTPPEKRNALHGEARDQIRQLVTSLTNCGLLVKESVGFSNGRLAYDDVIARTCLAIEHNTLKKHINNATVEDFYRSNRFTPNTITIVGESGNWLLKQIRACGDRVRFNKGTLQTWLIYGARVAGGSSQDRFLATFEKCRSEVRQGYPDPENATERARRATLRIYDDRASYRVTDVSSVLLRDLTLHLFQLIDEEVPPTRGSDSLLSALIVSPDKALLLMTQYIESQSWGAKIVGANHA